MRILEYEQVHVFGIAVGLLARARPSASPRKLVLRGAPLGRPGVGYVPLVTRDEQRVVAMMIGIDDVAASALDPGPEVRAFPRLRAPRWRQRETGGDVRRLQLSAR